MLMPKAKAGKSGSGKRELWREVNNIGRLIGANATVTTQLALEERQKVARGKRPSAQLLDQIAQR
jgi:hypothetical protein